MTEDEFSLLFHRAQVNLVAFKQLYEPVAFAAMQRMVEMAIEEDRKQRPWAGLTDDEVSKIIDEEIGFNSCWGPEEAFARAVEAKLKEKNT